MVACCPLPAVLVCTLLTLLWCPPCVFAAPLQHLPEGLLEDLLPGPVTLLLQRRPDAPLAAQFNPGVGAIGIRIPDSAFIRAVCRQHRAALALTSANISGSMSSVDVGEFQVRPGGWAWLVAEGAVFAMG